MRKSKRSKRHGGLTETAKQLYALIFGVPLPRGWHVELVGFMRGAMGLCLWSEKRLLIGQGDHRSISMIPTLVHELIHVRYGPALRHGKEFRRYEQAALETVWPDVAHGPNSRVVTP